MKKMLAVLLAMLMVLSLCACGAEKEAPKAEAPAAEAPAAEAPAEEAPAEEAPAAEPTDMEYVKEKGVLVVGITEFAPMDYLDENNEVRAESVSSFPEVEKTDYTGHIVNPAFEGNSKAGWSGSPTVDYNCAEKYNTTFDVYQVIEGLPQGQYLLTCQGFYRAGITANAASTHKAGTEKLNAVLYAKGTEEVSTPLQSIIEEAGQKGAIGVMATGYGYVPNTMEQTSDIGLLSNSNCPASISLCSLNRAMTWGMGVLTGHPCWHRGFLH